MNVCLDLRDLSGSASQIQARNAAGLEQTFRDAGALHLQLQRAPGRSQLLARVADESPIA